MHAKWIVLCIILIPYMVCLAQVKYDNHVFFDNSITDGNYYYSSGSHISPSFVESIGERIPVEKKKFLNPPNSLKLRWISKSGGNWQMAVHVDKWRGRDIYFDGNVLFFWCYSEKEIPANSLPKIYLKNVEGAKSNAVRLDEIIKVIPANEWTHIKIPLDRFIKITTKDRNLHRIKSIYFTQCLDDGIEHTLYIDQIKISNEISGDRTPPATPNGLECTGYAKHIELKWNTTPDRDILYFKIYRSFDEKNFSPVGIQKNHYRRYEDFIGEMNKQAFYRISVVDQYENESELSNMSKATTRRMSDEELLSMVQEACFRYYWDSAHPNAGMALENIPGDENLIAVGASGFGIMATVVGEERGFITREQAVNRMTKILNFLKTADRFHGVWPHFLDGRSGKVVPLFGKYDNGGDLVETAFLIQGLLVARQYFNKDDPLEKAVRDEITNLWETVEWDWYRRDSDSNFLYWHWSPDYHWKINHPLVGWNETMIVYLLAIASPTHSVPASMYYSGWAGQSDRAVQYRQNWGKTTHGDHYVNDNNYYGITLDVGVGSGGPLFFTHYSFMGFDPRNKKDKFTNYFRNNRNIALINQAYCVENPKGFEGYGANCWGLTASDDPWGYTAHEPIPRNDNGTMTPTGALASFPYTPKESMNALKYFYYELGDKLWGIYGFRDAFNLSENWVANIYMGLNQAPITVMIENYRSGLIWNLFMANPEIHPMLKEIGFVKDE